MSGLLASTLAFALAATAAPVPLTVGVRFEVAGLPMPPGTGFPRLPAGLPVALVPEVSLGGAPLTPAEARRAGLTLRWLRLDPAEPVTSNLQRERTTGATRLAPTPLRTREVALDVPDPWRVDADLLALAGTVRFMVAVDRPGERLAGATPGPADQLELPGGEPGGLSPAVLGLTRRTGEDLAGAADELAGVPFLLNPLGEPPRHQTEARVGTDCTSTFVYGMRRLGRDLRYFGPTTVWPYLEVVARDLRLAPDGAYRDAAGAPVPLGGGARPGALLHFGTQLSLLAQDRWPFGLLDEHDLLLQAWRSTPHRVTVRDSGYADAPAALVRFRADLPRRRDAGLVARVEDSHAGSFFHLRAAVAAGATTLVVLDAHDDAAANPLAGELAQHEADPGWLRALRARGAVQPTDWIDALIPWGLERVRWLGPWDELDRAAAEAAARGRLCALVRRFPDRGFECRARRFDAVALDDLLALPPEAPVVVSVDLDYLLRADGVVDLARADALRRVLRHFKEVRGLSVALSRPWFPGDATFERALLLLSAALQASGVVEAAEVDLAEVQQEDRSLRARALLETGRAVPRPRPEQIEATPGLRLVAAPRHATFGLLGDVYLPDAARPVPAALPLAPRPPWQPVERLPLLANLETPVVERLPVQGYPTFNRHGDLLDLLGSAGVLLVSVANNHALDQGVDGLQATIRAARSRGIGVVGGWLPGETARGVERLTLGDLRVAVLGVTASLNLPAPPGLPLDLVPFDAYPQAAEGRATEASYLEKVRAAGRDADLVIVLAHGGAEYVPGPSVGQQRFFRALAAAGARVVAGAHAHLPAGHEIVDGALLAWGLGDVLPRPAAGGVALLVTAEVGAAGTEVRVREAGRSGAPHR